MPGTLGSFPKLRWKLEAKDKVYVCVCGGVYFYDCIPSQTFNGELCLTISILQTTQWKFGELWPMRVSNLALKMTTWYHTAFLWQQNKPRNFLEGWFWLSNKCKLKVIGWVWLKGNYKPSLPGIAQRLWDGPWVGREEELLLQTMALGHSSKHTYNLSWKKSLELNIQIFFKKIIWGSIWLKKATKYKCSKCVKGATIELQWGCAHYFHAYLIKV